MNVAQESIGKVEKVLDFNSPRCGRLVVWKSSIDPFLYYGIGLSDSEIFDTGLGLIPFKDSNSKIVSDVLEISFSPEKTIERLKHAISYFFDWNYQLLGWNREHLARLIATGLPRSY